MEKLLLLILPIMLLPGCKVNEEVGMLQITSPDKNIVLKLSLKNDSLKYAVNYGDTPVVLPSALGFEFEGMDDLKEFETVAPEDIRTKSVAQSWKPVWGESSEIRDEYEELSLSLVEKKAAKRKLNVLFRVFDEGIAFRYELPEQEGGDSIFIKEELSEFRLAGDYTAWWIPNDYDSYEHWYSQTPLSAVEAVNTPVTFRSEKGLHIAIHEAALTDYAGMTLKKIEGTETALVSELVPWPDGIKVKTKAPMKTPWRTIQISDRAGGLMESNMILNLNEPNVLEDTDWIRPMKYIGIWWGMHVRKYTWEQGPKHGATTENTKEYMDFAAKHDIGGVLVEGWNVGWHNWSEMIFDRPYDDFDIFEITEYGRKLGVDLIGHHETGANVPGYERQLDEAFAFYKKAGVKAVKTGYVGKIPPENTYHHGQRMVNHYRSVLKKAAENKIMINVHEPIKDTGIRRTYPNMMSREGACGQEYNAWSVGNAPEHELILPFTRMLGGPMDYTPGIFDILFKEYSPDYRVWTTLAKQLSLYVILFSPLQMAADNIENYEGHPAFKFIDDVPTVWDETRVLDAAIADYILIARRSADEWYVGAATDELPRLLNLDTDFLSRGQEYALEIYGDALNTGLYEDPAAYEIKRMKIRGGDSIDLALSTSGGAALRFVPLGREEMTFNADLNSYNATALAKMEKYKTLKIYERPNIQGR